MRIAEAFMGLVPAAKPLGIIITVAVSAWFAGVGFTIGFGETSASIKLVPEIKLTLDLHATRILEVEQRLGRAESASSRLLCLVTLSVTEGVMDPLDVERECP
tara:strand:+ start:1204 stop:1512 length:309 start_codon:yes stop_codon:yes gene_type:complete